MLLLGFPHLKMVLLGQVLIQNVLVAATADLPGLLGVELCPPSPSSDGATYLVPASAVADAPPGGSQQQVTSGRRSSVPFPPEQFDRVLGRRPRRREDAARQRGAHCEEWPFRNYEPLNQRQEISRFPKTAAQGIWPGEILFMA